jgi:hypothetical protein
MQIVAMDFAAVFTVAAADLPTIKGLGSYDFRGEVIGETVSSNLIRSSVN